MMVPKKKTITLSEIERTHQFPNYEEECRFIRRELDAGRLIRCGRTHNGLYPALPVRYRLPQEPNDDTNLWMEEIQGLSIRIDHHYYLAHPDKYILDRRFVQALSHFLKFDEEDLREAVSEKQRSFQIWQQEKGFEKHLAYSDGSYCINAETLLKRCGLTKESLNIYPVGETFQHVSATEKVPQTILIVENVDPFYEIARLLQKGSATIFGEVIDTVLFGHGTGVTRRADFLHLLGAPYLNNGSNRYLYWGDLDREGIAIYQSAVNRFPARLELFWQAYHQMLQNARLLEDSGLYLSYMKEDQKDCDLESFLRELNPVDRNYAQQILARGNYIPQEIIKRQDYEGI